MGCGFYGDGCRGGGSTFRDEIGGIDGDDLGLTAYPCRGNARAYLKTGMSRDPSSTREPDPGPAKSLRGAPIERLSGIDAELGAHRQSRGPPDA